jgi:uncharacterized protein (TIGR02118 family)
MPMVKAKLGAALWSYTVDKGLAGVATGAPATFVAMCHLFCDSVETFMAGFGLHAKYSRPTCRTARTLRR